MLRQAVEDRVFSLLADLLDYPVELPVKKVQECLALVSSDHPEAAASLLAFLAFTEEVSPGRLEEIYTVTFDLDAALHPYVGYHLFGESYKRSVFMLELKERYRASGFVASETDLPDRLSTMLRFLAAIGDEDIRREVINEALLPTVRKMARMPGDPAAEPPEMGEHQDEMEAYQDVLDSLRHLVSEDDMLREEIMSEGLLPTLKKRAVEPDGPDEEPRRETYGYEHVLQALRLVLQDLSMPARLS